MLTPEWIDELLTICAEQEKGTYSLTVVGWEGVRHALRIAKAALEVERVDQLPVRYDGVMPAALDALRHAVRGETLHGATPKEAPRRLDLIEEQIRRVERHLEKVTQMYPLRCGEASLPSPEPLSVALARFFVSGCSKCGGAGRYCSALGMKGPIFSACEKCQELRNALANVRAPKEAP